MKMVIRVPKEEMKSSMDQNRKPWNKPKLLNLLTIGGGRERDPYLTHYTKNKVHIDYRFKLLYKIESIKVLVENKWVIIYITFW